jgi:hypothetical protein
MAAVQRALLLVLLLWEARGARRLRVHHRHCSRWAATQQQQQHKAALVLLGVLAMHGSLSALQKQQPWSNSSSSSLVTLLLAMHMLEQLAPQPQQQAAHCSSCQALTMSTL